LHPCGEGGEFETVTLWCPIFRREIILEDIETIIHSDDAFAPVAYLRFKQYRLQDVDPNKILQPHALEQHLVKPFLVSPILANMDTEMHTIDVLAHGNFKEYTLIPDICFPLGFDRNPATINCSSDGEIVSITNIRPRNSSSGQSVEDDTVEVLQMLREILGNYGRMQTLCMVTLILRDMNDFSRINKIYNSFFSNKPPARYEYFYWIFRKNHIFNCLDLVHAFKLEFRVRFNWTRSVAQSWKH
jgi:diphthine-ammonia ligase